ncbi:MAG: ferredoxin [Opitutus sp.]
MATLSDRLAQNSAGKYYVDSSCIDCDQCRVQAPELFGHHEDGFSFVQKQPVTAEEAALMEEALAACATESIGDDGS